MLLIIAMIKCKDSHIVSLLLSYHITTCCIIASCIIMTLTGWRLIANKVFFIPQRYVLGIMGLFALANSFAMRVTLSMTITEMVYHVAPSQQIVGMICPDPDNSSAAVSSNSTNSVEIHDRYDWNESKQGILLSAFYYGYVVTHLPGGMLAERFSGKWTLGIGLLITSISTILTPWSVKVGDAVGLFIIRVLNGAGEGVITPAFMMVLSRWVPPSERSTFGALVFGGGQIGNIFCPLISGLIMADGGHWANVYYLFGSLGVIWCLLWVVLCYSSPQSHPFISEEEREYLDKTVVASGLHKALDRVPFRAILRSIPLWALVIAYIGHGWGHLSMMTVMPKYFSDVLKFNIKQAGFVSALPYIAMFIFGYANAVICDLFIKRKLHSITTGRKVYTTVASTGSGIFLILASLSGCDRMQAVACFIIAMALMGAFYSSIKVNCMDLAPNYAGTCSAIANGIASISGIVSPYLIGLMTPDQTVEQWRLAFWIILAILVGTNIVFLIWGAGEQQWWDDIDKHGYPLNWKHGPLKKSEKNDVSK